MYSCNLQDLLYCLSHKENIFFKVFDVPVFLNTRNNCSVQGKYKNLSYEKRSVEHNIITIMYEKIMLH